MSNKQNCYYNSTGRWIWYKNLPAGSSKGFPYNLRVMRGKKFIILTDMFNYLFFALLKRDPVNCCLQWTMVSVLSDNFFPEDIQFDRLISQDWYGALHTKCLFRTASLDQKALKSAEG